MNRANDGAGRALGVLIVLTALSSAPGVAHADTPPPPDRRSADPAISATAPSGRTGAAVPAGLPPVPNGKPRTDILEPKGETARRAFQVFDRHCARCHDSRRLESDAPQAGLANILDLDRLALRRDLIRPGSPEGSPLYLSLLTRRMPHDVLVELKPGDEPSKEEIANVRRWIEGLPSPAECRTRPPQADSEILMRLRTEDAVTRRYLMLGHLQWCSGEELAAWQAAARELLVELSKTGKSPEAETLPSDASILTFDLGDIGWTQAQWRDLVAAHPTGPSQHQISRQESSSRNSPRIVTADWLANATEKLRGERGAGRRGGGKERLDGLPPVAALTQRYNRDLDLKMAAIEMGLPSSRLETMLLNVEGPLLPVASRLRHGLIGRPEYTSLSRFILLGEEPGIAAAIETEPNEPPPDEPIAGSNEGNASLKVPPLPEKVRRPDIPLRLSIWPGQTGYASGDPIQVYAAASAPCHLTLLSLDMRGEATVIFPTEYQSDNLLVPGRIVRVPGESDAFSLRVEHPGSERIVGICMKGGRKSPPGISHDFELQPFTLLGSWDKHIAKALEADKAERRNAGREPEEQRRRARRRRTALPFRHDRQPLLQSWDTFEVPGEVPGERIQPQPSGGGSRADVGRP